MCVYCGEGVGYSTLIKLPGHSQQKLRTVTILGLRALTNLEPQRLPGIRSVYDLVLLAGS